MKKNILVRTNILICLVIVVGFLLTAVLGYKANFNSSLKNIEQVSDLTSEGIFYQMSITFSKPVNISLTMANDSLLHSFLTDEQERMDDPAYIDVLKEYLSNYKEKYGYDSVFLVSAATSRYYNFDGLDRVLVEGDPENTWYYDGILRSEEDYSMNVDNDEVAGAGNAVTVFVNCKIYGDDGALLGVVGVGVRIDGLQRTLQSYQDEFGVNACLISKDGTIELSSDHTGYEKVNLFEVDSYGAQYRQKVSDWQEADQALAFWAKDSSGQPRDYIVARYLPEIQWHLVVERDTGALMQELYLQLSLTVVVIILILTIVLFIITNVIRRFNRRIVELTQTVEQERQDVFEKMTEQLFDSIYEIDITHNLPANRTTEKYFESLGAPHGCPFDKVLRIIAEKQIREDFRQGYLDTFLPENVLRAYQAGTDRLTYEFMITEDGQTYFWMRITAGLVAWESDGSVHMLVYRQNIDAEKRQEQKMLELARRDEMTGLLTKTATQRRVDELLKEQPDGQFAYFIFDIDNFKQANDRFGHEYGDTVIMAFTRILRQHFRKEDVLGRIGGDEFVVFVPYSEEEWVRKKTETLCRALHYFHKSEDMTWQMSASIGVALSPAHGVDAATLYKNADIALYQTKKRGKNGFTIFQ